MPVVSEMFWDLEALLICSAILHLSPFEMCPGPLTGCCVGVALWQEETTAADPGEEWSFLRIRDQG